MKAVDVIRLAYREAALRPIGSSSTPEEQVEGLYRLNSFISQLFGVEIGEVLRDWAVPGFQRTAPRDANYQNLGFPDNLSDFNQSPESVFSNNDKDISQYPPINSRLIVRVSKPMTVWFPQFPQDGARMSWVDNGSTPITGTTTIDANGRRIEGALTLTLAPTTSTKTWLYRADLANWIELKPLDIYDETPLPVEFDDLFVVGLAVRLAALDEVEPKSGTLNAYARTLKRCQQRYINTGTITYGGQNIPNALTHTEYENGYGRQW